MEVENFPIQIEQTFVVPLVVSHGNKSYDVIHIFREPDARTLSSLQKKIPDLEGKDREYYYLIREHLELIYQLYIKDVCGYDIPEEEQFYKAIPFSHKVRALTDLMEQAETTVLPREFLADKLRREADCRN